MGAAGVEIDLYYDAATNDFVVSHDFPYHLEADGSVLLLEEAFTVLPPTHFWLDVKNLAALWPWQAAQATQKLRKILQKSGRAAQVLVESRNPFYLRDLANYGVKTTLMISPDPSQNVVAMWTMIIASKLTYAFGDFHGISMNYRNYQGQVQESFAGAPAYLSTLNDESALAEFLKLPQFKVFLTDKPSLYGQHCNQ